MCLSDEKDKQMSKSHCKLVESISSTRQWSFQVKIQDLCTLTRVSRWKSMSCTCWLEFSFQVKIHELYMLKGVSRWKTNELYILTRVSRWNSESQFWMSSSSWCSTSKTSSFSLWLERICLVSLLFPITVVWNSAELWIWIELYKVQSILLNPSIISHGFLELVICYRYDRPPTLQIEKFKKAVEKYDSILRPW